MTLRLLTEHQLEFLSLKGGYTGSSESTLVKMPHCCMSRLRCFFEDRQMSTTSLLVYYNVKLNNLKLK